MTLQPDFKLLSKKNENSSPLEKATSWKTEEFARRHIRSFSNRSRRITSSQRRALEELSNKWCIAYNELPCKDKKTDWITQKNPPLIIDIGFGMGDSTVALSKAQETKRFLGIEVYPPGVGSLLNQIEKEGLQNTRIIQHDAFEVLTYLIPQNHLEGVHLFFPDPWPKNAHHKRRLVQKQFSHIVATRLCINGYFHCTTDSQSYAEHILQVLSDEPLLIQQVFEIETEQEIQKIPEYWRTTTKFKKRSLAKGDRLWHIRFDRLTL